MTKNFESGRNTTAKALLSIYDAKEILRKDQELFHKTLSDLKSRLNFISKKKEVDSSSSNGQKVF